MFFHPQSRARDIVLRLSGLVLLAIGSLALDGLCNCVSAAPGRAYTPGEFVLAALGLLCVSPGALLLALGGHIFDRVEISERWSGRRVR